MLLDLDLKLRTGAAFARFRKLSRDPARTQLALLRRILEHNAKSSFGREHSFGSIETVRDFQDSVAVRAYDGFEPYVERIAQGEANVLTSGPVRMFATTSGTTGRPKLIPVTDASRRSIARLIRLWMYRCAVDHQGCFAGTTLAISAPAIEGFTPGGIPFGSMSGMTYERLPALIRSQFAVPYAVTLVKDPDVRYFLTMRFALGSNVSSIATPNATTLLRLAGVAKDRSEELVRAVNDGSLGVDEPAFVATADAVRARDQLRRACRADRERARRLTRAAEVHGHLRPREAWPNLRLIGCWLGGTAGRHAGRLSEAFGDVPKRDLGLIASEGRMSLPLDDETPLGVLALDDILFEFIPDAEDGAAPARPLLAHELEAGKRYRILLTGLNGLYRYDLSDVVEPAGRFEGAPLVAFVRKSRDFASITGEKVHVNQVAGALHAIERELSLDVVQFRLIPDVDAQRYDLLVEGLDREQDLETVARLFDAALMSANVEYASKRGSSRVLAPRLFAMRAGWSERQARADFASGKREHQYKFACMRDEWDAASRDDVERAFDALEIKRV